MKKSFVSFFNKPSHVVIVSLIIALAVGAYSYVRINKKQGDTFVQATSGVISNTGSATSVRNLSLGFLTGGRIQSVAVKAGDTVKKGEVLATLDAGATQGTLTQAKASFAQAQASLAKVVNGATGPTIDVARAQVHTAQVNLSEGTKQQDTLVANAHRNLLNSTITPESTATNAPKAPIISGTYTSTEEGTLTIKAHPAGDGGYFVLSGLATGTGSISATDPVALGTTGLSIVFPQAITSDVTWTIDIPNIKAANYLTNYNTYQSAVQTRTQMQASLQASVDQANASLTALVTAARPEDVATAQAQVEAARGTLEIAQAAYGNTVITAPYDGTVTNTLIAVGQIAVPNASAIELEVSGAEVPVSVMIPKTAVMSINGKNFVMKKEGTGTVQTEVTLGISDALNVEVISGLQWGDSVVIY